MNWKQLSVKPHSISSSKFTWYDRKVSSSATVNKIYIYPHSSTSITIPKNVKHPSKKLIPNLSVTWKFRTEVTKNRTELPLETSERTQNDDSYDIPHLRLVNIIYVNRGTKETSTKKGTLGHSREKNGRNLQITWYHIVMNWEFIWSKRKCSWR